MLASMLMESALGGVPMNVAPELLRKYTHEDGASLIAMESAEDIHEIFYESFYTMESLEFSKQRATMEGASADVMEGIVDKIKGKAKAAMTKIKEKLKALWEKVKAFFKNTKTYLMAIFQNGAKFAKANQKMLKELKLDNDFEYEVYKYDIENACKAMTGKVSGARESVMAAIQAQLNLSSKARKGEDGASDFSSAGTGNMLKKYYDDLLAKDFGGANDEESLSEYIWGSLRGGIKSAAEKEVRRGKIDDIVAELIKSTQLIKTFNSMQSAEDDLFKKAIDKCSEGEKADEAKLPNIVAKFREFHSVVTKLSNLYTKITSFAKGAVTEMVKDYMVVVRKALRYKPAKNA